VSYNEKHNWANGEGNNDGANDNKSWNSGTEGPTGDTWIEHLRNHQVKNFATLLMLSQGVPMITGGDEMRRTQGGNNNAYCQDSELSWHDWTFAAKHADVVRFFSEVIALRMQHPLLRRGRFYTGAKNVRGIPDISFHGTVLDQPQWNDQGARLLAVTFGGADDEADLHLMMNMSDGLAEFELPQPVGHAWRRAIDTSLDAPDDITPGETGVTIAGSGYLVNGRSVVLLVSTPERAG